ncbi:MAG: peptidylprolyl isomerase [Alphaproteobacteria bacterium]
MSRKLERHGLMPVAGMAAALIIGCALLASCGKKEGGGAASGADNKVLAKVDGSEIRQSDLNAAKAQLPAQYQGLPDNVLMPALMEQLIQRRAAVNAAIKAGLDKDADIKKQIDQAREDVLQTAYLKQQATKAITDAQVRDVYQQDVAQFQPQTEIRARHILMCDETGIKLAAQRVSDGETFEAVASEMSVDSQSAQHGGDLGYFTRDRVPKEIGDTAFALNPGQVSAPFALSMGCGKGNTSTPGWDILKVLDKRQTQAPTFEQAEAQIRGLLTDQMIRQKLTETRNAAKVERMDPWANIAPPQAAPASGSAAPPAAPASPPPASSAPATGNP